MCFSARTHARTKNTKKNVRADPVVAHWAWNDGGWASPYKPNDPLFGCGVIDFAGSGVVHVTGGMAALVGIFVLGPRAGKFNEDGTNNKMPEQSAVLSVGVGRGGGG